MKRLILLLTIVLTSCAVQPIATETPKPKPVVSPAPTVAPTVLPTPVPTTTPEPTATPSPELVLPWEKSIEDELATLLERGGYKPGSAMFSGMYNTLIDRTPSAYPLFLPWADAAGRNIEDLTLELWEDFFRAFMMNAEFRRQVANTVRDYLDINGQFGPLVTALLKSGRYSFESRVTFVARIQDAMNIAALPKWMWGTSSPTRECTPNYYRCWEAKRKLTEYLEGKDPATITAIPNPWQE